MRSPGPGGMWRDCTGSITEKLELELTRFGGHPEEGFGGVPWEDFEGRIRWSSGGRWWSWCARGARLRSCRGSSSRRRSRSGTGFAGRIGTKAGGPMVRPASSARSRRGSGVRTRGYRHRFRFRTEARIADFHFIEGFYNPTRRHPALGIPLFWWKPLFGTLRRGRSNRTAVWRCLSAIACPVISFSCPREIVHAPR